MRLAVFVIGIVTVAVEFMEQGGGPPPGPAMRNVPLGTLREA